MALSKARHNEYPFSASHVSTLIDRRSTMEPQQPHGSPPRGFSMNDVIGWILQGGVLLSSAVICVGIVLWLLNIGHQAGQQLLTFPHTVGEVESGLLALHPQAVITLGLLLLLATPVVRVCASIFAFALEHDRRYVAITALVLSILLVSFLLGKGAG